MLKEYRTLLPYWKQYLPQYLLGILFLFITNAGQMYLPILIRTIIDHIGTGSVDLLFIRNTVLLMTGVALLIAVGRFGWRFFIHGTSRRIETALRQRFFDHLLTLSSRFYNRNKVGDLMARATGDMNHIRMASGMGFVALFDGISITLFILILLFTQYPSIAWMVILPFPLLTAFVLGVGSLLGERFKAVQEGYAAISGHVQEALSGIGVIKSFVQERFNLEQFGARNENYKEKNMDLVKLWGFFFPVIGFFSGIVSLLLLRIGGYAITEGVLSAGDFVAIFIYLEMLVWPMMGVGFTVNLVQRGGASLFRINAILNEEPDIASGENALDKPAVGDIHISGLSYRYPDAEEDVLKDLELTIPEGSTLGILGRTGAGKSTFIKLLPRLLDPPKGTVSIGGVDIHDYELPRLRASIGMVPQETFLFSTTIRENITFAHPEIPEEDVERSADISTINRDLSTFPHGILTEVGERGISLSGGQKQRIAISRAVAVHPGILIFDDALSSVDTSTEERILTQFLKLREGKTNIIISHRVSTLEHADQIIVLENGRITQKGTHAQLIGIEGFYQEIFELQKLEEAVGSGSGSDSLGDVK